MSGVINDMPELTVVAVVVGEIPAGIGKLQALRRVDLSCNDLVGMAHEYARPQVM